METSCIAKEMQISQIRNINNYLNERSAPKRVLRVKQQLNFVLIFDSLFRTKGKLPMCFLLTIFVVRTCFSEQLVSSGAFKRFATPARKRLFKRGGGGWGLREPHTLQNVLLSQKASYCPLFAAKVPQSTDIFLSRLFFSPPPLKFYIK